MKPQPFARGRTLNDYVFEFYYIMYIYRPMYIFRCAYLSNNIYIYIYLDVLPMTSGSKLHFLPH